MPKLWTQWPAKFPGVGPAGGGGGGVGTGVGVTLGVAGGVTGSVGVELAIGSVGVGVVATGAGEFDLPIPKYRPRKNDPAIKSRPTRMSPNQINLLLGMVTASLVGVTSGVGFIGGVEMGGVSLSIVYYITQSRLLGIDPVDDHSAAFNSDASFHQSSSEVDCNRSGTSTTNWGKGSPR